MGGNQVLDERVVILSFLVREEEREDRKIWGGGQVFIGVGKWCA